MRVARLGISAVCGAVIAAFCTAALAAGTPAGTVIQNSATLSYANASGQPQPDVASNVVNVSVSQVAAVQASAAATSQQAAAGSAATYALTITNKGNGADTFGLAAASASSPAWTAQLYKDDGANGGTANDGVRQSGETNAAAATGSIAAEAAFHCFVVVQVPAGAAVSATDATTLTATSQFNAQQKATATLTTTATGATLVLTKAVDKTSAAPGEVLQYTITYENAGSASAQSLVITDNIPSGSTYVANSVYLNGSQKTDAADADQVTVGGGVVTVNVGNVAAGVRGTIVFSVRVN